MAAQQTLDIEGLLSKLDEKAGIVDDLIQKIRNSKDLSMSDMFTMQREMNLLSQFSEMCTQLNSAMHQALLSMARNIK